MLGPLLGLLVDDVHEDRLFRVWRENPGTLDHATALAGDDALRGFAEASTSASCSSTCAAPGSGWVSRGRHGPRTELRRHGYERIWAYAPREKQPGLLSRLFGRG